MDAITFKRIKTLLDNSGLLYPSCPIREYSTYNFSKDTILVTGAAGSIGSGLAQQLSQCKFKKLILIDNAETPLFFLKQDIGTTIKPILYITADIKNTAHMAHIFNLHKPTLIFHAAAYKHVTMAENNAFEAIKTNISATVLLSNLAIQHKSKKFIFISSDKAVDPTSIMGMTKCIAENYLSHLDRHTKTIKFISARFGNIFGSNGSVVPLFIKQLTRGEHITINDEHATRLFIDKHKACDLILNLSQLNMSHYSKVCFDMGSPIKIKDIAEALIALFKTKNGRTTQIKLAKLSQGEKLHETLISQHELLVPSEAKAIHFIECKTKVALTINLENLNTINYATPINELKATLLDLCGN